jgi:hypothetical protein
MKAHRSNKSLPVTMTLATAALVAVALVALEAARAAPAAAAAAVPGPAKVKIDDALAKDWLARWEKNIVGDSKNRYCDKEMGEEIGWLISPFLNGYYYGYQATGDPKWMAMLVDWADAWIKRGIKEPDGYLGWPKAGTGGAKSEDFYTDSELGEAMALRPIVLAADVILKTPALKEKYGRQAESYLKLAEQIFEKWDKRGCWREVTGGGLWVVPLFGIDPKTGQWTDGYAKRATDGFSHPDNKENHIALWLIAMYDVTGKPVYRDRAEKWWRLMRSRMHPRDGEKYLVWNYWDPAGPWDYSADGSTKHWVGVHPNGGYYGIDVDAIATAYEHGLVFTKADLSLLIATNRDFMWNQKVQGAKFQRIDGGKADDRWKDSPGVLWTGLVPYDATLQKVFEATHNPSGWGGLSATPWYLSRREGAAK